MSAMDCPSEAELVCYVDRALTPEQLERIERHLPGCIRCATQHAELKQLVGDLAAPLAPASELDVDAHVAAVMARLDTPVAQPRRTRGLLWGAAALITAAAALLLVRVSSRDERTAEAAQRVHVPRVSLELFAGDGTVLVQDAAVAGAAWLRAGLRNRGGAPAYVLLFALDAQRRRHWISPHVAEAEHADAGQSGDLLVLRPGIVEQTGAGERGHTSLGGLLPKLKRMARQGTTLPPAAREPLFTAALPLSNIAPGRLRVIGLVTPEPHLVAEIDLLPIDALGRQQLQRQFPDALIIERTLDVRPSSHSSEENP